MVILDLVDDELLRVERHSASASAHYFHVLVEVETGARGIALDLTRRNRSRPSFLTSTAIGSE